MYRFSNICSVNTADLHDLPSCIQFYQQKRVKQNTTKLLQKNSLSQNNSIKQKTD